jgi:hypothetical protein
VVIVIPVILVLIVSIAVVAALGCLLDRAAED